MLKSLHLKNTLSFRDTRIDLEPLNILIGPNASGKSNLIETVSLLQATPNDLVGFFRRNGPVADWIWKGEPAAEQQPGVAEINAVVHNPTGAQEADRSLTYNLRLAENKDRLQIVGERLENILPYRSNQPRPYYYFNVENGYGQISTRRAYDGGGNGSQGGLPDARLTPDNFAPTRSVLSERRDPDNFPVLTETARRFASMRLYRNWNVGRDSPARKPQPADDDIEFLDENFENLALVINDLQIRGQEKLIDQHLNRFYQAYQSLRPRVYGGTIQLVVNETGMTRGIPATRLSDGTIRFVALLTILYHPQPPELICIEEPELAMHPDAMPLLADMLQSAAERTQLIVTTHSPELVDQFTAEPSAVLVCERDFGGDTQLKRQSSGELEHWLNDYRLGDLWRKGAIGGNRW